MSARQVHCPHCAASLRAPPATWGKQLKCPKCRASIQVPMFAPMAQVAPAAKDSLGVVHVPATLPQPTPVVRAVDGAELSELERQLELEKLRREVEDLRQERRERRRHDDDDYVRRGDVITIQRTGKGWKAIQAIGALLSIGTGVWMVVACAGAGAGPGAPGVAGAALLAWCLSLLVWFFGRLGAWWCHG